MASLSSQLVGNWTLRSREDRTQDGQLRIDPFLGPNPVGLATFDSAGNFGVQLMKRDRDADAPSTTRAAIPNNTAGVDGYDSYFGTFVADDATGVVTQTLHGNISPRDVGRVVTRHMQVENDVLTIQVETSTLDGEAVTRTLVWERVPGT
jgi:hypothetical protein